VTAGGWYVVVVLDTRQGVGPFEVAAFDRRDVVPDVPVRPKR